MILTEANEATIFLVQKRVGLVVVSEVFRASDAVVPLVMANEPIGMRLQIVQGVCGRGINHHDISIAATMSTLRTSLCLPKRQYSCW